MTFPGAPHDGRTLAEVLGQAEEMPGVRPHRHVPTGPEPPPHARSSGLVETWSFLSVAKASIPCQEIGSHYTSGALPAQGDRGRHVPCDHVRLRT